MTLYIRKVQSLPESELLGDLRKQTKRIDTSNRTTGTIVQPGKILSKEDRERERESNDSGMMCRLDGYIQEHRQRLDDLDDPAWLARLIHTGFDVSKLYTHDQLDHGSKKSASFQRHPRLRDFIQLAIAFLLVYGGLSTVFNHLLFTGRASAECTTATMYIPVTTTVTYMPTSTIASLSQEAITTKTLHVHSTLYSTSTLFRTMTVLPAVTSMTALSSSGGPSYFYGVNSGTTSWLNGISPDAGALLTTATTSFFISPVATLASSSSDTSVTIQSTATDIATVTPPPYTSTVFSMLSPGSTTTSTRTRYVTMSV
ncbi:hypothetical protein LTR08_004745 [Meristemomyces frigidus]|nr:hypothetical protein LTR08_004745 [Meristemomyces frigidus]